MVDGSIAVTPGSGANMRVETNSAFASGAFQQVVSIAGADGILSPTDPDGTMQVSPEPSSLFIDDFSGTLTAWWTTGGTVPTTSGGNLTTSEGTTASATSYLRTNGSFMLRAMTYLRVAFIVTIEGSAVANNTRWWGYGSNQTTPSATAPVLNGAVFLIDSANSGALTAAIFSNGAKTTVATLTRPTDALQHRYEIAYRQSIVYWIVDGVTVASRTFPNLAVAQNLNVVIGSANTATAPAAHTFSITSVSVGDQGDNAKSLADGILGYIQNTIKAGGSPAPAISDNPLYVEALQVPSQTLTATAAANTAVSVTLPASGAGLRHYVTAITVEQYATAATTGSATPLVTTASNHTWVTTMPTAMAIGAMYEKTRSFNSPMASTAQNTATVFTAPATASIIWRFTVSYYSAP